MTVAVANVNSSNTSTWGDLILAVNYLADAMSSNTVTVGGTAATGNAVVNGSFQTTTMYANSISGGTIGASGVLTFTSNVVLSASQANVAANVSFSGANVTFSSPSIVSIPGGNSTYFGLGVNPATDKLTFYSLFQPSITTVANNDMLRYNGSNWVNVTPADVLDVLIANSASNGQVLSTASGVETLTNKTITTSGNNTITLNLGASGFTFSGNLANFNTSLSDGTFSTANNTLTLINKTINSANNTLNINLATANVSGNSAQFNAALSDATFLFDEDIATGIVKKTANSTYTAAVAGSDFVSPSVSITAGTGLSGGGTLSTTRTLSADISSNTEAIAGILNSKLITPQSLAATLNNLFDFAGSNELQFGDIIIKYGNHSCSGVNSTTVTFPEAFPNSIVHILVTPKILSSSGGLDSCPIVTGFPGLSSFTVSIPSKSSYSLYWMAIGT